jgi:two-component system response regulator BaeR
VERVLIVEDEPKISAALREYLENAGYAPHILDDGLAVVDWVKEQKPSLILLDLMLPGKDGLEICRDIRTFSQVPIIMVTARVEEIDRLLGLEFGADDYVCKPFSPREVVARVKANLRRVTTPNDDSSSATDLEIDELRHIASLDGHALELTRVEFRILQALLDPPGRVFSRDQLLDRMYDDQRVVGDRTVDSHMANLRRKLQAVRADSECIHSVYGLGYKLEL